VARGADSSEIELGAEPQSRDADGSSHQGPTVVSDSLSVEDRTSLAILLLLPIQLGFAVKVGLQIFHLPPFGYQFWLACFLVLAFETYRDSLMWWHVEKYWSKGVVKKVKGVCCNCCGLNNLNSKTDSESPDSASTENSSEDDFFPDDRKAREDLNRLTIFLWCQQAGYVEVGGAITAFIFVFWEFFFSRILKGTFFWPHDEMYYFLYEESTELESVRDVVKRLEKAIITDSDNGTTSINNVKL